MLDIRPGELATTVVLQHQGVRHLVDQANTEKPAVGNIDFGLLRQASLGANSEQVANDQHLEQPHEINN